MMQRRFLRALRNDGLSAIVSALALIIRLPIAGSFAQLGINPHFICFMYLWPSSPTTTTFWVGAMLYRGVISALVIEAACSAAKRFASAAAFVVSVNRP